MSGCGYSEGDWDCRKGGYLYDAGTGEGYDPEDCTHICPACRTLDYLEDARDEAESVSYYFDTGYSGTGVKIWTSAEQAALLANPVEAKKALSVIGVVSALEPADNPDGYSVVLCNTQEPSHDNQ